MSKFEESNFYKALQDFFINADKKTFLQFLAEFYNRTEGIIDKNNIQDDLIKELRELYLEFNENGIDENIVREKVNYFLENSLKIKDIISKLTTNTNNIENITSQLDTNTNNIENITSQLDTSEKNIENADNYLMSSFFIDTIKDSRADISDNTITPNNNKHNAFTSMVKFNNKYVIVYRVGTTHVDYNGKIVMKTSDDGLIWSDETVILSQENYDFRDGELIVFNGKLVLRYVRRNDINNTNADIRKCFTIYTTDLMNWSTPVEMPNPIGNRSASRGNMTIKDNELYSINYDLWSGTFLLKTNDLITWSVVKNHLLYETNETSILWTGSKFIALFRMTDDTKNSVIGFSNNGIDWSYKTFPLKAHCPTLDLINLNSYGNTKAIAITYRDVNLYNSLFNRVYFNICFINENGNIIYNPYMILSTLANFDNGYGSVVEDTNNLYISYYTSNKEIKIKKISKRIIYNEIIKGKESLKYITNEMSYINSSNMKTTKNIQKFISGDINVIGDGTNKKEFTIDLSSYNLTSGGIHVLSAYVENGLFQVRIKSVSLTEVKGVLICDNVFTTNQTLRYNLIYRI